MSERDNRSMCKTSVLKQVSEDLKKTVLTHRAVFFLFSIRF